MGKPLRALIIEDSEADTELLLRELRRSGYEVQYKRVETAEAMRAALAAQTWDVVLSDYNLPKFSAPKALEVLKISSLDLPLIIISGTVGDEMAVAALKAGAEDFIVKTNMSTLGPAIEQARQGAAFRREQTRTEKTVQTGEELFGTAFRSSPVGICITSINGRLQTVSQSLADMLGYTQHELEGKHFREITHPEDIELGNEVVKSMIAGTTPSVSFEKRYLKKNGQSVWALVSASLLRDSSGTPVHFITHILNMTERKQAEEQARAQAARLKILAEASKTFATSVYDYQDMLQIVARYTAEYMNGLCGVRLLSEDGQWLEMATIYDQDMETLAVARKLASQPMRADEPNFVQPILRSEQAFLLPGVSEEQLRGVVKPEDWAHLRFIASQSRLIATIRHRDQALGFLIISRKPGAPVFEEQDLQLAQDLADRAALAISNARLFQQVQKDLAERRQADEALRESEERLSGIIASAMDALITVDEEQHITLFNPAAEKIFGYSAEQLLGQPLDILLPERFRPIHRQHIRQFGETEITTRTMGALGVLRGLRANGEEFPIEASISHLEAAGQKFYTVILRDISERHRAQAAMLESEARYQRVLDAMMEGCQIIDFDWRYVYVNDVVASQGKNSRAELLHHTMMEVYPGIEQTELFAVLRQCMEARVPKRLENQFLFPDGSTGWFELSIQPAQEGIFILSTDITERKRAEEMLYAKNEELRAMSQQLWQAAKLATMGELAASIAHELNNPLATVSLRTEMLIGQFSPNDPPSKSLRIIDSEVKRMGSLVGNLLQFSRQGSTQISSIKVNEEVENTLELIQYHLRKNAILTVRELSPDLPLVQADRQQLRQVFLNLFTNAADAMPLGGMLTIRTWIGDKPQAGITAPIRPPVTKSLGLPVADAPQVYIEVSDTGDGISADKIDRIWEPFYTTKAEGKGTGLGLAICRRIVQEHGGTIEINSEGIPGKGATVHISLPAVKER